MSAPTPAPGDESPREGYYPDPSIPGYVRYWNGASWVPGTSRPAPRQTDPAAAPAAGAQAAPVEETGPIFFDEEDSPRDGVQGGPQDGPAAPGGTGEPAADHGDSASVWQADAARQSGFGGERDRRVDWGGAAQGPAERPSPTADPRAPLAQDPAGGALPAMRDGGRSAEESGARPPADGTVTIRAVGPRAAGPDAAPPLPAQADAPRSDAAQPTALQPDAAQPNALQPAAPAPSNAGTQQGPQNVGAAPDSLAPAPAPRPLPAPSPHPQQPSAQYAGPRRDPVQAPAPVPVQPAAARTPLPPGPGGGSASWARQVHPPAQSETRQQPHQPPPHQGQSHQPPPHPGQPHPGQHLGPGADQPVVPWKPPVDDPFQQLARNQAAARPAGLGKRFAARLVDSLVLGAVVGAAAVPLATRALDHIDRKITAAKETGETVTVWLLDSTTGALLGALLAAFLLIGFLLEALPTAKWGRTLGKRLCGLDVRDIESHESPTLGAALRRWLVYGVLGLLVIGVVNVLWCLVDRPWRQCWHDKAARTFVAG
ncbi:RDD family protein [Streptomyces griseus]|uniref:RDD family protein n=1 Tax=Streptomyces griseus TaxID=1911 RepID=UPI0036879C79